MKHKPVAHCPSCGHTLSYEEIKSLWGTATNALRTTFRGGRQGGRPPSPDRCPCGAMTRGRAAKRKHVCEKTS